MMVAGYVNDIRRSVQSAVWPGVVLLCSLVGNPSLQAADVGGSPDRVPDAEYGSVDRASNPEYGSADGAPDSEYDAAAHPDETLLDSSEQVPGAYSARNILREAQDKVLGPCLRNSESCRSTAAEFLARLKGQGMTVEVWALFQPIRNNMYFYLMAPSLRLAQAIVKSRGSCDDWQIMAAGAGVPLQGLIRDAALEVGGRTALPESKELRTLQALLRSRCASGTGFD